jgi:ATP-binding cassette subfamily F protein uup
MLSVQDATVRYTDKTVFENLSFNIHQGNKIALVGNNGAGKSTLMHIITGQKELDEGDRWQAQECHIGYLEQDVAFDNDMSVFDFILSQFKADEKIANEYKVKSVTQSLNLNSHEKMGELSGGQLRRAALAKALVEEPNILLLDEPTNHLDLEGIEWLEGFLNAYRGTILCVSHDKTFLSNITNKVFWLDRGRVRVCPKGFRHFDDWATMLLEQEKRELRNRKQLLAQETEWASRSPQGRRKRNVRRLELMKKERDKLKADQSSYNRIVSKISLNTPTDHKISSRIVAEFYNVHKSFNKDSHEITILEQFNMRIMRGDRIGILGKNGSGKTTFLKLLIGELSPDKGKVKMSKTAEVSYFDQKRRDLNLSDTLWKTLCPAGGEYIDVMGKSRHVCGYLKDFLFDPSMAHNKVSTLSGGEKNRLMLAKVLANPGNFLILDEPTNDLDMDTLDMLEEILSNYEGTLFVVSHDRDFLDQTVSKILAFEGNGDVQGYIGGYSDYIATKKQSVSQEESTQIENVKNITSKEGKGSEVSKGNKPKKLTYKLEYELKKLPDKIKAIEVEIEDLNNQLHDPEFYQKDQDAFNQAAVILEKRKAELEEMETRWLELEEMREQAS